MAYTGTVNLKTFPGSEDSNAISSMKSSIANQLSSDPSVGAEGQVTVNLTQPAPPRNCTYKFKVDSVDKAANRVSVTATRTTP